MPTSNKFEVVFIPCYLEKTQFSYSFMTSILIKNKSSATKNLSNSTGLDRATKNLSNSTGLDWATKNLSNSTGLDRVTKNLSNSTGLDRVAKTCLILIFLKNWGTILIHVG